MARQICRACGTGLGVMIVVTASRERAGAMQWRVEVCRDCWRAWEALLDGASRGVQPGLAVVAEGTRLWFL